MKETDFTCGVPVGTELGVSRAVCKAVVRENGIEVHTKSPFEKDIRVNTLPVTVDQYSDWLNGTLVQNAMPHLSADDRELLISGMVW